MFVSSCIAWTALTCLPAPAPSPIDGSAEASAQGSVLTFRSRVSLVDLGSSSANDCWGYVSPSGREYALTCTFNGTVFVEITDPSSPVVVSQQPGNSTNTRDVKVYQDHAYVVGESGPGVQVFDLSDIDAGTVTYVGDITAGGTASTHNVAIDEVSGFLYRCRGGSNGLRIYDLNQSLTNPPFVGSWSGKTAHDAQVVTYTSGPLSGKQIAFCSTGWAKDLTIVDVTNKASPTVLSSIAWPQNAHSHQGWLDARRKYFYLNDEYDETTFGLQTRTMVFDVSDPSAPFLASTFSNGNPAIGHNAYIAGDLLFEANYTSGLRVFDLSVDPLDPPEIDWYDTYLPSDAASFAGLFGVYAGFPSGTVIGSDEQSGLYIWSTCTAVTYCTAGTSAAGCQATLSGTGTASASASSGFTLTSANVEGQKTGMFFFGANGRQANTWGSGSSFQCVAPPVLRAGLLPAAGSAGACDGSFAQDLNALWCPTCPKPGKNPGAGATVQAQLWYRDPQSTSNQTTSLSDALEFCVKP